METETLTEYKSTADMHLMDETTDKTIIKNGDGLDDGPNSCEISYEKDNDRNSVETESKEPSDNECTKDDNSMDKKDDTYDSDVEEEEEHVPLNIETNSDLEKSDDDLDESNEPTNNYDSEKEESCSAHNETNVLHDSIDTKEEDNCTVPPELSEIPEENCSISQEHCGSTQDPLELGMSNAVENVTNESINSIVCQKDEHIKDHSEESVKNEEIQEVDVLKNKEEKLVSCNENIQCTNEGSNSDSNEQIKDNDCALKDSIVDDTPSEIEQEISQVNIEKQIPEVGEEVKNDISPSNDEPEMNSEKLEEKKEEEQAPGSECPLLMETLTRKNDDGKEFDEDGREDDIDEALFDPSLLCPDISMEVDEDPVITTNDAPPPPQDGNKSPMLYEPIFSTFVDEMTGAEVSFNLSIEEECLRQETYGDKNPVQFTKIHCTACNIHLGSALDGQGNRFVHPLLKVLICKNCYHFYTSGEFEKDEDGSELYCRWCGQGGQVMCCSNCEMVFCKKCIRINFDRKKLAEIRDSDEWMCFRCNPNQLTSQRIQCAEFMEYVRREISRAATLDNATSFMTTDYTHCCTPQKKKTVETPVGEPKKKKRKTASDPDYDPFKDREETESPQPSTSGYRPIAPKTPVPATATSETTETNKSVTTPQTITNNSSFKPGTSTFKPRTPIQNQPRPRVQVITPSTPNTATRPKISGPGYIKILPGGIRVPGNTPTPRNMNYTPRQMIPTITQAATSATPTPAQNKQQPIRNVQTAQSTMKHEWFEKTVRAAARVNSNLSYTLTQLNRAQANAQSVESLAVVHNKLQEILSTSINSLIQIRKNLRTEFIAGIKNIRFPPVSAKPTQTQSASQKSSTQDDDVIFISPPTSPIPPPLKQLPSSPAVSNSINLPSSVSIIRKASNTPNNNTPPKSAIATPPGTKLLDNNNGDRPKTFLRVKSLTALQNVPAECITIPDDPLPPPPPLTPLQKDEPPPISISDKDDTSGTGNSDVVEIIDDSKEDDHKNASQTRSVVNGLNADQDKSQYNKEMYISYNLQEPHSKNLKQIMNSLKIVVQKSTEIDELVKNNFNRINGDISE